MSTPLKQGARLTSTGSVTPVQNRLLNHITRQTCSKSFHRKRRLVPSCPGSRPGVHVVALRNYSGHYQPVSSPIVNEKGIVVRQTTSTTAAHLWSSVMDELTLHMNLTLRRSCWIKDFWRHRLSHVE